MEQGTENIYGSVIYIMIYRLLQKNVFPFLVKYFYVIKATIYVYLGIYLTFLCCI
jgi:hypothetical protein